MITSSKEVDCPPKKEDDTNDGKISKASSSSAPWLRLKDPRIVRVSRAFGGKDRHSKVCTIRGLRDRRVRLSVATAIQLYDLQDRLGLNQPSKVVDWLLNAAKHDIDELPPLPLIPGNFSLNHQAMLGSSRELGASQSGKEVLKMSNSINWEDPSAFPRPNLWNADAFWRAKSKEVVMDPVNEKQNWTKRIDQEDTQDSNNVGDSTAQVSSSSFLHRASHSSLPTSMENDPRQINHFQVLTPSTQNLFPNSLTPSPYHVSQPMKPSQYFSATPSRLHSDQNSESPPDKDPEFPCK
ncbi:hypothetical protein D5086_030737 [Populus alba]|uniref:Uncharacterized protein n=1 Tax=Populus alba TaxID=43335 RepID=A0ACC4AQ52_POPAL